MCRQQVIAGNCFQQSLTSSPSIIISYTIVLIPVALHYVNNCKKHLAKAAPKLNGSIQSFKGECGKFRNLVMVMSAPNQTFHLHVIEVHCIFCSLYFYILKCTRRSVLLYNTKLHVMVSFSINNDLLNTIL